VDEQTSKANEKFTWYIEIPKVSKDDLVIIPKKLAKELGGCCQLLICYKITTQLHFIDPLTVKRIDVSSGKFFQYEEEMLTFNLKSNGCEFLCMDSEKIHNSNLNESYVSSITNKFIDRIYNATVIIFILIFLGF
jgi:nonsense-mediated mRNA decay protein 3